MQRFRQIAPLNSQRIHRRLTPFSGLFTELNREVNNRRDSDEHSSQLADRGEHFPVHQICFGFSMKLMVFRSGKVTTTTGYLFSRGAGAEAARSEFHMSAAHFQFPSVCFSQTSRYFPRSSIGLPLASFIVNSYVPLTHAISPELPSLTLVGFHVITRPGAARTSFHTLRIVSF